MLFQLLTNIDGLLIKPEITHKLLSESLGRSSNWFNDAYNNAEDIRVSSLTKILAYLSIHKDLKNANIGEIFCDKSIKIADTLNILEDEDHDFILQLIKQETDFIQDVISDLSFLETKNKLNEAELESLSELKKLIKIFLEAL